MDAKLDEELIHLSQIGSVSMRVEKSGSSHRVPNVNSHNLCATTRWKLENFNVLAMWERAQKKKTSEVVSYELVGWWVWWEESELRRHWWSYSSHITLKRHKLSLSLISLSVFFFFFLLCELIRVNLFVVPIYALLIWFSLYLSLYLSLVFSFDFFLQKNEAFLGKANGKIKKEEDSERDSLCVLWEREIFCEYE